MLDRMGLSIKNQWLDEKNRVYIIFTVEEIMELLGCASNRRQLKVSRSLERKKESV